MLHCTLSVSVLFLLPFHGEWKLCIKHTKAYIAIFFPLRGLPLPGCLPTVPVSRNFFQQLVSITLCLAFLRTFLWQPRCRVPPSNTNFSPKSCPRLWIPCWLLTNTAVTSAVTSFRCHKIDRKSKKQKNSDMENFICNQYGERLAIFKHRKHQN